MPAGGENETEETRTTPETTVADETEDNSEVAEDTTKPSEDVTPFDNALQTFSNEITPLDEPVECTTISEATTIADYFGCTGDLVVNAPLSVSYLDVDGTITINAGGSITAVYVLASSDFMIKGGTVTADFLVAENQATFSGGTVNLTVRDNNSDYCPMLNGSITGACAMGATNILVNGGTINISNSHGATEFAIKASGTFTMTSGAINSDYGICANGDISISGGEINITEHYHGDMDSIKSDPGSITISGGTVRAVAGIYAEDEVSISGGDIEALEIGANNAVAISGGSIVLSSRIFVDDGDLTITDGVEYFEVPSYEVDGTVTIDGIECTPDEDCLTQIVNSHFQQEATLTGEGVFIDEEGVIHVPVGVSVPLTVTNAHLGDISAEYIFASNSEAELQEYDVIEGEVGAQTVTFTHASPHQIIGVSPTDGYKNVVFNFEVYVPQAGVTNPDESGTKLAETGVSTLTLFALLSILAFAGVSTRRFRDAK